MTISERDHRGRFAPGHAGRGGRPKGFAGMAKLIAEETEDGAELVRFAIGVFRDPDGSPERRWEAMRFLVERGWGKPASTLDVSVSAGPSLPPDWSALSPGERLAYLDRVAPPLLAAGDDS